MKITGIRQGGVTIGTWKDLLPPGHRATLATMSDATGIAVTQLSRYLNGRCMPAADVAVAIAEAMAIDTDVLVAHLTKEREKHNQITPHKKPGNRGRMKGKRKLWDLQGKAEAAHDRRQYMEDETVRMGLEPLDDN